MATEKSIQKDAIDVSTIGELFNVLTEKNHAKIAKQLVFAMASVVALRKYTAETFGAAIPIPINRFHWIDDDQQKMTIEFPDGYKIVAIPADDGHNGHNVKIQIVKSDSVIASDTR